MREKENEKREKLHALGLTDAEIAEICGTSRRAIEKWRKRRGLEGAPNNYLSEAEHMRRLELYWRGLTDVEIGEKFGYSWTTIFHWRERNNLPPSHKRDRGESLCWECERATPSKCSWVDRGGKVWKRVKRANAQNTSLVVECEHFKLEGKEEAEMREELDKAKLDYKIAEIEFNYAEEDFRRAAILKLEAARERLNAVIREAKVRAMAEREGGGTA